MAKWSSSSKRTTPSLKRFVILFVLLLLILFWDLISGVLRGFYLVLRPPDTSASIMMELLQYWGRFALVTIFFLFTFSLFLLLVAHFILPNLTLEQHLELWKRLWLYLSGKHGAAVFVRNGKILAEYGEKSKRGVGLLLIDRQSAVIVEELGRNFTSQVKVLAPGVAFLNPRQKIRGSVDLRPQRRSISDLHAYTKDGVEVITSLSTVFTLGQMPEVLLVTYDLQEPHKQPTADSLRVIQLSEPSPSLFRPHALQRMVSALSNEIDPDDQEEIHRFVQNFHLGSSAPSATSEVERLTFQAVDPQRILSAFFAIPSSQPLQPALDWSDLPLQIAMDLFREFIASIPYQAIYFPHRPFTHSLTELKSRFSKYMRNQGVLAFQFVQRKDNHPIRVGEEWDASQFIFYPIQQLHTPKFLRSKGIKILNATFGELRPADETIEKRLFEQWLLGNQQQPLANLETTSGTTPQTESSPKNLQMTTRLAQALNGISTSNQMDLTPFLAILEDELNDPQIQKELPAETLQRFQELRNQFSKTRSSSLPSENRT
jgi:hypothetical protein